jgi:hypothetical protein
MCAAMVGPLPAKTAAAEIGAVLDEALVGGDLAVNAVVANADDGIGAAAVALREHKMRCQPTIGWLT